MTLEEFCKEMPPWRVRLLARTGHGKGCRALSWSEIAQRSGKARSTVIKLLSRPEWGDTGIQTIDALMKACGVTLGKTEAHRKLVKRGKFAHLENANPSQRKMFGRMLELGDSAPGHQVNGPRTGSNPD